MTKEEIKDQIDLDITNKTTRNSVTPVLVGTNLKNIVDLLPNLIMSYEGVFNTTTTPIFKDNVINIYKVTENFTYNTTNLKIGNIVGLTSTLLIIIAENQKELLQNQLDAINSATSPSTANPFVTQSVLNTYVKKVNNILPDGTGNVVIPDTSLTEAGLVNINIINDQNLGKGNKTITLSNNTSTTKGFLVKGSDNNTKFGVLENNFIESNVQHVFRNSIVINQPSPLLQMYSNGDYIWIRKLGKEFRIGNGVAQGTSTLALEVDKNIASIGESSQSTGINTQKGCLEVKSDTRGSITAPIMTQARRLAITELTPGLQVTQISSDSQTIEGVYIYISAVVGWKKILIEA